jgi:hypothetical protein
MFHSASTRSPICTGAGDTRNKAKERLMVVITTPPRAAAEFVAWREKKEEART